MTRSRLTLVIAVVGFSLTATCLAAATPADATSPPAPVTSVSLSPDDIRAPLTADVEWSNSVDTDESVVCYEKGATAPTAPTASATVTCSSVLTFATDSPFYQFTATGDTNYSVSVFSYDSATSMYGSPVSATNAFVSDPVHQAIDLETTAGSRSSVTLHWRAHAYPRPAGPKTDPRRWQLRISSGIVAPQSSTKPDAILAYDRRTFVITGLTPDQPYTASLIATGKLDTKSRTVSLTFATRPAGVKSIVVVGGAHHHKATAGGSTTANDAVSMTISPSGRQSAVYADGQQLLFADRAGTGPWSQPVTVAHSTIPSGARFDNQLINSSTAGVAVAWNDYRHNYYRIRATGRSTFGPKHPLCAADSKHQLEGLVLDNRGKVHALFERHGTGFGYCTNATGKWTDSTLADPVSGSPSFTFSDFSEQQLTIDPVTQQLVIGIESQTTSGTPPFKSQLSLATAGPRSARPSQWTHVTAFPTAGNADHLQLVSDGGEVTVGTSATGNQLDSTNGLWLLHGSSVMDLTHLTKLPAPAHIDGLVLTAARGDRTALAVSRFSPSWRSARRGVFTESVSWSGQVAEPGALRQLSDSPYSRPVAIRRLANGHLVVGYTALFTGDSAAEQANYGF